MPAYMLTPTAVALFQPVHMSSPLQREARGRRPRQFKTGCPPSTAQHLDSFSCERGNTRSACALTSGITGSPKLIFCSV